MNIKEFDCLALIDTGANVSFVSLLHILTHKLRYTKRLLGHCEIANGTKQKCLGTAMITFTLGDEVFTEKFFVLKELTFSLVIDEKAQSPT